MNKQQLINENASIKKRIILFSNLTGATLTLLIVDIIVYIIMAFLYGYGTIGDEGFALSSIIYVLVVVLSTCGICAFTPFIVINAIKYGKRNRLIARITSQEQQDEVEII